MSLRAQRRKGIEYYQNVLRSQNVTFGGLFAERGESAFKRRLEQRPEGRKLHAVLRPGDHVVVVKLDRAFRSIMDYSSTMTRWQKRGIHIHLLDLNIDTTTPTGDLLASIVAKVAEFESKQISRRIVAAFEECRRLGRATSGTPPIGYRKRRQRLISNPTERKVSRRILRLRRAGRKWREIAELLNREGIKPRKLFPNRHSRGQGTAWRNGSVSRWARAARLGFPSLGVETLARRA